jgi:hypothetical protein
MGLILSESFSVRLNMTLRDDRRSEYFSKKVAGSKVVNGGVNGYVLAARNGADDICPAHNANELITVHDRNALDVMGHH